MVKISKEKALLGSMVCAIGAYKTYNDYKRADKEDKKNTLIRDTVIFTGTAAGAFLGNKYIHLENKPDSKKIVKFLKYLFNGMSIPIGGIVMGSIAGELADRQFPVKTRSLDIKKAVKNEITEELSSDKKLEEYGKDLSQQIDPGSVGKTYSILGVATGAVFDDVFSVLSGFNVGREQGIKNKILKASYEIIAGQIIPVTLVVATASLLKKKKLKGYQKALILTPVTIVGCLLGNMAASWFNKTITENLVRKEFYNQIYEKQKALALFSLVNKSDRDAIQKKLDKLNFLHKNVDNLVKTKKIDDAIN